MIVQGCIVAIPEMVHCVGQLPRRKAFFNHIENFQPFLHGRWLKGWVDRWHVYLQVKDMFADCSTLCGSPSCTSDENQSYTKYMHVMLCQLNLFSFVL